MRRADLTGPARSSTPPILHPDGTPAHGSVAALEHITLGESHQWVLLRGHSSTNPVVLFLSGGLDGSDITTIRRLLGEIEAQATVVTWDSRGAGKSLFAGFPRGTMTVRQLTADALELVAHLRKRFGQKRIVLVGHSLGTVVAVRMVQERPEWFSAYVSLGQLV
ncbi:MAG: alpha/beta fold hydrolase, partial [Dactylosporangium sp.]|nr:alpha/beta hydrolase [Dactylosporangium sp.]NNJ62549.1 alpha/beta fold hydrolase [Dactylosporangium sp.]